jgi:hypothetical protein
MVYCTADIAVLQEKLFPLISQEGYRVARLAFTASDPRSRLSSDNLTCPPFVI